MARRWGVFIAISGAWWPPARSRLGAVSLKAALRGICEGLCSLLRKRRKSSFETAILPPFGVPWRLQMGRDLAFLTPFKRPFLATVSVMGAFCRNLCSFWARNSAVNGTFPPTQKTVFRRQLRGWGLFGAFRATVSKIGVPGGRGFTAGFFWAEKWVKVAKTP